MGKAKTKQQQKTVVVCANIPFITWIFPARWRGCKSGVTEYCRYRTIISKQKRKNKNKKRKTTGAALAFGRIGSSVGCRSLLGGLYQNPDFRTHETTNKIPSWYRHREHRGIVEYFGSSLRVNLSQINLSGLGYALNFYMAPPGIR